MDEATLRTQLAVQPLTKTSGLAFRAPHNLWLLIACVAIIGITLGFMLGVVVCAWCGIS